METMKRSLIVLGCLLIAGPALAQSVGEKTGVNSTLGISPSTPDFVKQVAVSDLFEIESNELKTSGTNAGGCQICSPRYLSKVSRVVDAAGKQVSDKF